VTTVLVRRTINMTDVDLVQVNYSRFFLWMDEAYMALLRACGHPLSGIIGAGFATPVVAAECDYRRPVTLDDEFTVTAAISRVGRTSYVVSHRFEDESGTFALGRTTHVWISTQPSHRAVPVPEWIRAALEADSGEVSGR
jgi:4-hydroxybenzoyl-CoA thioesterase